MAPRSKPSPDEAAGSLTDHPLQTRPLLGHEAALDELAHALREERFHHAWLLTGPKGIGKATLAFQVAARLLSLAPEDSVWPDLPAADSPVIRQIINGAHPTFRVITRQPAPTGKLRREIVVDQVRSLATLFQTRAADGQWRVVIIDSLDDLATAGANALLKMLEEPPARSVFFLISHAPGGLMPTLISRCRRLALRPLSDGDTSLALAARLPNAPPEEIAAATQLAKGRPGEALLFARLSLTPLAEALRTLGPHDEERATQLAAELSGVAAQPRFEAFLDLALREIATRTRLLNGSPLAVALTLWDKARSLCEEAMLLSLDPRMVTTQLLAWIRSIPYEHRAHR